MQLIIQSLDLQPFSWVHFGLLFLWVVHLSLLNWLLLLGYIAIGEIGIDLYWDKTFLKEQIDLISPNVIICGGTFHAFRNAVYDNIEDKNQLHYAWNTTSESSAWTHNNRLVINFYHPSYAFNKEDLFENLCSLLIEGKVFEKFNWD